MNEVKMSGAKRPFVPSTPPMNNEPRRRREPREHPLWFWLCVAILLATVWFGCR